MINLNAPYWPFLGCEPCKSIGLCVVYQLFNSLVHLLWKLAIFRWEGQFLGPCRCMDGDRVLCARGVPNLGDCQLNSSSNLPGRPTTLNGLLPAFWLFLSPKFYRGSSLRKVLSLCRPKEEDQWYGQALKVALKRGGCCNINRDIFLFILCDGFFIPVLPNKQPCHGLSEGEYNAPLSLSISNLGSKATMVSGYRLFNGGHSTLFHIPTA